MQDQQFNPAEASRRLREVSLEMEQIGAKIIQKRNAAVLAEAAYLDAKAAIRKKNMGDISATALQQLVDQETIEEKKALIRAEADLRNAQDQRDIIIEVNQNSKKAIDIWMTEVRNLNLQ